MGCESGTNRLKKLDYGNGGKVEYTYDSQGRLIQEEYEDGETVSYAYDNSGNLATVTDSETGVVTTYYYDLLNRQSGYREQGADLDHTVKYEYDEDNNLASMTEIINNVSKTYTYTYDDDNRIKTETVDGVTVEYTYDDFGRLESRVVKQGETVIQTSTPTYSPGKDAGTTTGQVSSYNGYTYTYDKNGNILTISDGTYTTSYEYDSANQLIWEYNEAQGFAHNWEYDDAGNILKRMEYEYADGVLSQDYTTIEYGYNDTKGWGDLLTSYDGNTITYDAIGNPLNDGKWTYTWQHGRQLASMTNGTTTWTYTYGADGMRTKKTDGEVEYTYVYNGDKLVRLIVETQESFDFSFTYDASGTPLTITENGYGNTYYYITNLQGDVIGIKDSSGQILVNYSYDAWGNLLYRTNTQLAEYNPLCYRGYVYDIETGLYYLQSRYYNPEWGRFINADAFTTTGQGILGNNMFAYCQNKPVLFADYNGYFLFTLIGTVVGALSGAASAAIKGKTGDEFWGEVANGAVSGAATGVATDVLFVTGGSAAFVCGVMAGFSVAGSLLGNYVEQEITGNNKTAKEYIEDAVWDGSFGALMGHMNGPMNSTYKSILINGLYNYLAKNFKKEAIPAIIEEVLSTITSDIGNFTFNSIIRMIKSTFE